MYDTSNSLLTGMTTAQLQAALANAQQAYVELMTGSKGVTFSYSQGDGAKSVSYQQTNAAQLAAFIRLLQVQLGMNSGRRPVRFNFR